MSDTTHSQRVLSMASGTLVSRITGLARVLVLAWVLGFSPIADAYNLANTVPNMLFDLVLGGIASATFIPVFVERLAVDGERKAWKSISNIVSGAIIVLLGASIVAWFIAPWIIDAFTFLNADTSSRPLVALAAERSVATQLLRWFVPQIFFYGVISIATALLNVRRRFAVGSWVPVANNLVCMAVLAWFHLVDPSPTITSLNGSHQLLLLGLGTSAGVVIQFLLLLPSLARADLWRMTFRVDTKDPALRQVARLGSWTLAVVLTNQASLYVILAYAFGLGGSGPVSAYTYGWSFMQMPYAVVVVSVLGALTPQLAGLATSGDYDALSARLRFGLRQSLVVIIPCTLVMIVLAEPGIAILVEHLNASRHYEATTVLAVLAAGLPGFAVFQLCVRGLQSMQRARAVFVLYVIDNGVTIALCIAFGRHSLAALTASVSVGYTIAAAAGVAALSQRGVHIASELWGVHVRRSLVSSLLATLVIAVVYAVPSWDEGLGLIVRTGSALIAGLIAYVIVLFVARRRLRRSTVARRARLGRL